MASRTIYPPLVNSYEPAFVAGSGSALKVYFSLSSLSTIPAGTNLTVHAQIYRQDGVKVLNSANDIPNQRYRATGILLNLAPVKSETEDNLYYITINNSDLKSSVTLSGTTYNGWIPGWIYKIQLRLSTVTYNPSLYPKQEAWLQEFSNSFSEWSTICYTKAIAPMRVKIPLFKYDSGDPNYSYNADTEYKIYDVNLSGTIENQVIESNEDYEYVEIALYQGETLLEESGEIYKTEQSNTYFEYKFKTEFEKENFYRMLVTYKTENGYIPQDPLVFNFQVYPAGGTRTLAKLITVEDAIADATNKITDAVTLQDGVLLKSDTDLYHIADFDDPQGEPKDSNIFNETDVQVLGVEKTAYGSGVVRKWDLEGTSVDLEEDEGRITLKVVNSIIDQPTTYSCNLCIRRSSQKDNFKTWEDICYIILKDQYLDEVPVIYDYTIESGVWYKYGIQEVDTKGRRGELVEMTHPVQRTFNYSYLLGAGGKQLKLQFNNTVSNYKPQLYDSKTDTIGSKYPFISRNAVVDYRIFPIGALISFQMDENNTFLTNGKKDIYKYQNIIALNDTLDKKVYDYTLERDFRELVLEFLKDGKPKLFKSPTEGNIIVRLTDINCSPNQSLDRLIYSLSCNANEFDANTMANYLKYGFYNPGTYGTDFSETEVFLGQISGKFNIVENNKTDNLFRRIYDKYDKGTIDQGGWKLTLEDIQRVFLTINGYYYIQNGEEVFVPNRQLRIVDENGTFVLGNKIEINYGGGNGATDIIIYDPRGMYEFDSLLTFRYKGTSLANDSLCLYGSADGQVTGIDVTLDFLYSLKKEPYVKHEIETQTEVKGIAQFYGQVTPGTDIWKTINYRHKIDSDKVFRYLKGIRSIEIEADPHTVFEIKDLADENISIHEINDTGILRLYELEDQRDEGNIVSIRYKGRRVFNTPYDDSTISEEINETLPADVSITYIYEDIQGIYEEEI